MVMYKEIQTIKTCFSQEQSSKKLSLHTIPISNENETFISPLFVFLITDIFQLRPFYFFEQI